MEEKDIKSILLKVALGFLIFAILVYLISYRSFRYSFSVGDTLSATMTTGEITDGEVLEQRLMIPSDTITSFEIRVHTYERENTGVLHAELLNDSGAVIATAEKDISTFPSSNDFVSIPFDSPVQRDASGYYTLRLYTEGSEPRNAIAIYSGNSVVTGRFDVSKTIANDDIYRINGSQGEGMLCIRLAGTTEIGFYKTYWIIIAAVYLFGAVYSYSALRKFRNGKPSFLLSVSTIAIKYKFLLKQLISRDFKIKYKRSALGMFWSFLNPLLTMSVQYIVFSTLFRSDIPNYPVYLLTGIVIFNYFTDTVGQGMISITSNASLIKKVYMPKYIYPLSKVLSCSINFSISFIPIFLVMLLTRTEFHFSLFLLVFALGCLILFTLGMVLIVSTLMTFFQDTQFIWSVLSMVWMYATPIFYPESIIPSQFLTFYHMNPMYQYITFARIAIIDGVSPAPSAYLWCMLSSVVVLLIGLFVFKKNQDKFILYL